MDELYLDNIDEYVNDHNKIVSDRVTCLRIVWFGSGDASGQVCYRSTVYACLCFSVQCFFISQINNQWLGLIKMLSVFTIIAADR